VIRIDVYGDPAPQGSKSAFRNQHTGRIQQVETSKKVKPWRQDIRDATQPHADRHGPLDGPIATAIIFTFPRPRSHWRTGRNAHLLRDTAPAYPDGHRNDLDKLIRAVLDAITSTGLWHDDGQIVRLDATKVYTGHPHALDRPGARIGIRPVNDTPELEETP
jgi:Holliday junction resolvase RusA-like endonuclease